MAGASRWRNPEDDLPPDFEDNRDVHYGAIRQPLDPGEFIDALQKKLREALTRFDNALELGTTGGVEITRKHGEPWIKVSPLGKQEEPENLVALKAEIERRWGTIDLIDILKEAEFATGFTGEFASVASREALPREVLRRRLLLVLFALGTNMGIKRVAVTGKHGESEAVLRRIRHLFVNRTNLRGALVKLVNATTLPAVLRQAGHEISPDRVLGLYLDATAARGASWTARSLKSSLRAYAAATGLESLHGLDR
ncbi:Tn3 family transposase [Kitasatospora sp. NPDC017646]|uniref:Tn3 family transposase n=1 Tax=Kitasatospora sp. NPDC017646 TaxID=3364024 RepID=UPI00379D179C